MVAGCASPGFPPGGPEDKAAPKIVSISPESGSVNAAPRSVTVRFDEVVNERPGAAPDLSGIVLISPRDGTPRVDWRRTAISIRPRRRWKANTVYSVTVLPGISDLRGNTTKQGATVIFSTGPTIPRTRVSGVVFDWVAGRPAGRAAVEVIPPSDTTNVYVTQADSLGRFSLEALPPSEYRIRAYLDPNNNRALDPREAWDTVRVALTDTANAELYTFVHDTNPPRVSNVEVRDSITLRVTFDKPLDPGTALDTTMFRLRGADSVDIPVLLVREAREWEKARADSAELRDSLARPAGDSIPFPVRRQPADTAQVETPPGLNRRTPISEVVIQVYPPLKAGQSYRLRALGARGLLGAGGTSQRVFALPKAATPRVPAPPPPPP
ncbi:MAG: Ig-like domain-containing protein [Gemmatimonadaceae bacterium]